MNWSSLSDKPAGSRDALLAGYAEAWAANSADAIAACWAPEHFRFYKAEEVTRVLTTWDDATRYWRDNEALHAALRLQFTDASAMPLDGPWSLLWCRMRWDIRFAAHAPPPLTGKAMGGENHVLALLHGDRFAGWSETPDAAITYVRALYEAQARI